MELPLDVLVHVFEFVDGQCVLCTCAVVCQAWKTVSAEPELWRRLIARRFAELHSFPHGSVAADALVDPCTDSYDMQDVYFRLARLPTHLHRTSPTLAMSSPPGWHAHMPTVATFTGEELGGNQTVRANVPWASSVARGVHPHCTADRYPWPPIGALRAVAESAEGPVGSRYPPLIGGSGSTSAAAQRFCAELQLVHYFEVTILFAPEELRRAQMEANLAHRRPCVAVGMCTHRFPLVSKMPGWDRHSFAYHGDDGCKFHDSNLGERYGPPFGEGDVIGCGVRLRRPRVVQPSPAGGVAGAAAAGSGMSAAGTAGGAGGTGENEGGGDVFFTLNGQLLADPKLNLTGLSGARLFPCIGIDTFSPVRVNFGYAPFCFDVRNVHPLSEPATLGLANPADRSLYCAVIKAHLRAALRQPSVQPPLSGGEPRDDDAEAVVAAFPIFAQMMAAGHDPWFNNGDLAYAQHIHHLIQLVAEQHELAAAGSETSDGSELDEDPSDNYDQDYESEEGEEVEGSEEFDEDGMGGSFSYSQDEDSHGHGEDWEMPSAAPAGLPEHHSQAADDAHAQGAPPPAAAPSEPHAELFGAAPLSAAAQHVASTGPQGADAAL